MRRALFLALVLVAAPAWGQQIGLVKSVAGEATLLRGCAYAPDGARSGCREIPAEVGASVERNDAVATGPDGSVGVAFSDGSAMSLGPGGDVDLAEFSLGPAPSLILRLNEGSLSARSGEIAKRDPEAMRVITPTATLGVRGTNFVVRVARR